MNTVGYADEIAATLSGPVDWKVRGAHVQAVVMRDHPVYLGMITAVTYNEKSDRYIVKFAHGTAKVTNDAANFLLREVFSPMRTSKPTVYAHMNDTGTVDSVYLLYLAKE